MIGAWISALMGTYPKTLSKNKGESLSKTWTLFLLFLWRLNLEIPLQETGNLRETVLDRKNV